MTELAAKIKIAQNVFHLFKLVAECIVFPVKRSAIYNLKQKYSCKELQGAIPSCKKLNIRPLRVRSDVKSVKHMHMTDSLTSVLNLVGKRIMDLHDTEKDTVELKLYDGKTACASHL